MIHVIRTVSAIVALWILGGCAPRLTYPPDHTGLQACEKDCTEIWKTCQGPHCETNRATCVKRCRDYGGLRGGGTPTLEFPTKK